MPGIGGLLMNGDRPATVDDTIIYGIRLRERNGIVVLPAPFSPGQPVRIHAGVLAGRLGIVTGMTGRERIAVLLGHLRANLPARDVAAI